MPSTEAQKRANVKYNREKTTLITIRLTQHDADILAKLDEVPNKQGYIKDLIRADIARKGTAQKKEEKTMTYHVKPEYLTMWGDETTDETVIEQSELERLAAEWEKPIEELLEQLIPID